MGKNIITFNPKKYPIEFVRTMQFCLETKRKDYICHDDGRFLLKTNSINGYLEVRTLKGEDHEVEEDVYLLPVFGKIKEQVLKSSELKLLDPRTRAENTLASLILANFPNFCSDLPVRKLDLAVPSPKAEFWLRWFHSPKNRSIEYQGMLAFNDVLLYLNKIEVGANDFFSHLISEDKTYPKGPFKATSQDIVNRNNLPTKISLFLVPNKKEAEIIAFEAKLFVSKLGNFHRMFED